MEPVIKFFTKKLLIKIPIMLRHNQKSVLTSQLVLQEVQFQFSSTQTENILVKLILLMNNFCHLLTFKFNSGTFLRVINKIQYTSSCTLTAVLWLSVILLLCLLNQLHRSFVTQVEMDGHLSNISCNTCLLSNHRIFHRLLQVSEALSQVFQRKTFVDCYC